MLRRGGSVETLISELSSKPDRKLQRMRGRYRVYTQCGGKFVKGPGIGTSDGIQGAFMNVHGIAYSFFTVLEYQRFEYQRLYVAVHFHVTEVSGWNVEVERRRWIDSEKDSRIRN